MLDQVERLRRVSSLLEKQLVSIRKIAQVEPISECEKCMEFADRVFESDPSKRSEIAISFLNHVVREHTGEVLSLLAEKYRSHILEQTFASVKMGRPYFPNKKEKDSKSLLSLEQLVNFS